MQNSSVEDTKFKITQLNVNGNLIDLTIPRVMGIINLTSDSFYASSRLNSDAQLLKQVEKMLADGATFIDLGGLSTRPNSVKISTEDEKRKIESATRSILHEFPEAHISIDTFRSDVAQAGIDSGAGIINDISGFSFDSQILDVIARNKCTYICMHLRGNFDTMHEKYTYQSLTNEVISYFEEKINILNEAKLNDIIIDPGFGFSKSIEQNYELLNNLSALQIMGRPILVGVSRKSMIYKKLDISPEESLNGTSILNAKAILNGASILRVHDVKEAKQVIDLL